jgi:nucleoside-diphosphate-sugar epimerase
VQMTRTLLSLGHGYSARALARLLLPEGWQVIGTTRDPEKMDTLRATGVSPLLWEADGIRAALDQATHVLVSTAPKEGTDPALRLIGSAMADHAKRLDWVGYLSTTAVYGDHQGGWVDEDTPLTPASDRGQARVRAERDWAAIDDLPLHIFRLAGIYGPGRGPFAKVRNGTARRVIKENQVFSRIHVDDIALALFASIRQPSPGAVYNLCDDDPAPPQDIIACAAELLGLPIPPKVSFEEADLSPMARSFYGESKRISNTRLRKELGVSLLYPDYRSGLMAILSAEQDNR